MENKQVMDWIDQNSQQIIGFLQELIRRPSVNPAFDEKEELKGEGDVQRYIQQYLQDELGLESELRCPDPEALRKYADKAGYMEGHTFEDRPNLYAECKGAGGGRSIMLSGHVDVVQLGEGWTVDPFGGDIDGDKLYGRGATDMKGGVAAMIMALKAIKQAGITLKGDVRIGTVVDEEAGGMGTLALVGGDGRRADACIITEGTEMLVEPLCRGILWGKLIVPGRPGHIEHFKTDWRTGGAVDAIDKARLYLDQIDRLNEEWGFTKRHPLLPIPCQFKVAQINAGEYPTTYAGSCEIIFDVQYLPEENDQNGMGSKVKQQVLDFVKQVADTDPWLRENPPKVEWILNADCGETPADSDFVQTVVGAVEHVEGQKPQITGALGHTDMGWFCNVGIPTINYGPGPAWKAHQVDEYVSIDQLIRCTKNIAQTILDWCGVAE